MSREQRQIKPMLNKPTKGKFKLINEDINELGKDYIKPTTKAPIEHLKDESLMLFSYSTQKGLRYRLFYGLGVVYRVVKGEKNDIVYINFGIIQEHPRRLVMVYDNHARRQLMTLKRGQICQVYGICRYYKTDINVKGKADKGIRLCLIARGILGWYVPTMVDIRKMPVNDDIVAPSEKETEILDLLGDLEKQWKD